MFEKLKKNIDKGIVSVSVKSSSYLETEKLKAKIDNIKSDSASQLQAMGDQIYQTWKESGTVDQAYIAEVCGKVQENENEIAFYEAKIEEVESEKNKILNNAANSKPEGTQNVEGGLVCSCGYVNDPSAKFCKVCGQKLEQPKAKKCCPNCHAEVEDDAKFCPECGSPIEGE